MEFILLRSKFHILVKMVVLSEMLIEIPGQSAARRVTAVIESNCERDVL